MACQHDNKRSEEWPCGSYIEVCNDCGMSRNIWEQGESEWIFIKPKIIEKSRKELQTLLDKIRRNKLWGETS